MLFLKSPQSVQNLCVQAVVILCHIPQCQPFAGLCIIIVTIINDVGMCTSEIGIIRGYVAEDSVIPTLHGNGILDAI